ncbi:MAG: ATP-binding protein [Pseudomonadota bacterium]
MLPDLVAGALGFVGAIALSAVVAGILLNRGAGAASFQTRLLCGAVLGLGVTVTEFLPVGSSAFGQLDAVPAGVLASAAFGGIVAAAATALVAEGGLLLKGDLDPWSRLAPILALAIGIGLARFHRMRHASPGAVAPPAIDALGQRLVRLPEGRWPAVGMLFAATGLFGLLHLLVPAVDIAGGAAFYLLLNVLSLAVLLVVLGHFSALPVDDLAQPLAPSSPQPSVVAGQIATRGGGHRAEPAGPGTPERSATSAAVGGAPERLALRRTLAEIVSAGQLRWVDAGLTGDVVIDQDLARDVLVNPTQLRTAIDGMIANAVDDTDDGALRVTARAGLSAPKDHLHLILTVSDEGRGTPESAAAANRPQAVDRQAEEGTGMAGIAPYRSLAEQMGGTLRAINVPGVGTTARLELMLRCVAPRPVTGPDTLERRA